MNNTMNNKTVKRIAFFIIFLTFLSIYSAIVRHVVYNEKNDLGVIESAVNYFSKFPFMVKTVLLSDEFNRIPPTYVKMDTTFKEINKLNYNLYGMNSFFNNKSRRWEIELFNLKNDSVIYNWQIKREDYYKTRRQYPNAAPRGTILLPDKSIIVLLVESNNLLRLDSLSNIIWHNTQKYFHHTMNLSVDSNIWVCSSSYQPIKNSNQPEPKYYIDDYLTKVDINSGEIILEKSVSELLIENNLKHFIFRCANEGLGSTDQDPLHLNDIEVTYHQSSNYNIGDLFLSFRHRSAIIQYRPSKNKVIRIINGPFLNQHDVDIISENEISLFDNNVISFGTENPDTILINTMSNDPIEFFPSYIVKYNFITEKYSLFSPNIFEAEKITTLTQGLHEFLSNGDVFVESQNEGKIYILNEKEIKLKKYFKTNIEGMVHQPHWIRIYENIDFLNN